MNKIFSTNREKGSSYSMFIKLASKKTWLRIFVFALILAGSLMAKKQVFAYPLLNANSDVVEGGGYPAILTSAANVGAQASNLYFLNNNNQGRIRQSGTIHHFRMYFASKPASLTNFYIEIWRKNVSNTWDRVYQEDMLSQITGVPGTINLTPSTTWTVQEGDYTAYAQIASSTPVNYITGYSAKVSGSTYWANPGPPTASGYAWNTKTPTTYLTPIKVYMNASPQVVLIGDSIIQGFSQNYGWLVDSLAEAKSTTIPYFTGALTNYVYQNMGINAQTTTQISARFTTDVVNLKPRIAIIEGGVNDIRGGSITQSTFIANWTSMLNACVANNIIPVIVKILPWSYSATYGGTNQQLTTRDTWNDALVTLAASYPTAIVVDASSYVGQERTGSGTAPGSVTPGNLWDVQAAYHIGDGLHFNASGNQQIAQAIADSLPKPVATFDNDFSVWNAGNITANYNLMQVGDPNTLNISQTASSGIEYSTDGSTWNDATKGTGGDALTGLASTNSPGTDHSFIWDSLTDLPNTEDSTVYLRIRPNDGVTSAGSWVVSNSFGVDNLSPSTPTASPVAGTYSGTQSVTLSASGSDSIRYSTVGTPSDCSSGTLYSTAISVSTSQTIYVRACDNVGNSSTTSFAYTITHTLTYSAGTHGSITGSSSQTVNSGASGSAVTAVPDTGYHFTSWSDASTSNPRTDTNVVADVTVTASFASDIETETNTTTSSYNTITIYGCKDPKAINYNRSVTHKQSLCKYGNTPINTTLSITKTLKKGMIDNEVKELQKFLNTHGYIIAKTGVGSVGRETNNFGTLTFNAVKAFQKANNLKPDGVVGKITREKMKSLNLVSPKNE